MQIRKCKICYVLPGIDVRIPVKFGKIDKYFFLIRAPRLGDFN